MAWEEIASQIHNDNYVIVAHQTWGHLFPEKMVEPRRGLLRLACGIYGDLIILDEEIDIEGSPWWHGTLMKFLQDYEIDSGEVHTLIIDVHMKCTIKYIPEIEDFLDGSKCEYFQYLEIKVREITCDLKSLT